MDKKLIPALVNAIRDHEMETGHMVCRVNVEHNKADLILTVEVDNKQALTFDGWKRRMSGAVDEFIAAAKEFPRIADKIDEVEPGTYSEDEAGKWLRTVVLKAESLGFDLAEAGEHADKCAERMERGLNE